MDKSKLTHNPDYMRIVATIDKEVDYVDIKPFSHNIIGLCLNEAATKFGKKVANDLIDEFELEARGWSKEKEDKDHID